MTSILTPIIKEYVPKTISDNKCIIEEKYQDFLKILNPIPLRLYGLPEVHKEGIPIRLVVSFVSSSTYRLFKFLNQQFKSASDFTATYSIHNSSQLVNRPQNHGPSPLGAILVSFDVSALYPNVFVSPTLDEFNTILNAANILRNFSNKLLSLSNLCLSPICKLNNIIYRFSDGLPMGCPLLSLLFEVFMNRFEHQLINSNHLLINKINL